MGEVLYGGLKEVGGVGFMEKVESKEVLVRMGGGVIEKLLKE